MKNYFSILSLFLMMTIVSCSEEPLEQNVNLPESRAIVSYLDSGSESNPNLYSRWETVREITLNKSTAAVPKRVLVPWVDGCMTNLRSDFCTDIKKDDGWTMLFHTFKETGLDDELTYMCFYNTFTGYLKVFYFCDEVTIGTNFLWIVEKSAGGSTHLMEDPHAIFNPTGPSTTTNNFHYFANETASGKNTMAKGWNGFQFHIGRYQDTTEDIELIIDATSSFIAEYHFAGNTAGNIHGVMESATSTDGQVLNAASELEGSGDLTQFKNTVLELGRQHQSGLANLGINVLDEIGSLTGNNAVKALSSIAKFLFPRSATYYYSSSMIRATQSGTVTLEGSGKINTNTSIAPIKFNLNRVLHRLPVSISPITPPGVADVLVTGPTLRTEPISLSVWDVKAKPVVYYNPLTAVELDGRSDLSNVSQLEFVGTTPYPASTRCEYEIKFNSQVEQYLKSYTTNVVLLESPNALPNSYPRLVLEQSNSLGNGLYAPDSHNAHFDVFNDWRGERFDQDTQLYWYWDEIGSRPTVALIEVEMTISYCGREFKITESRVYQTETRVEPGMGYEIYQDFPSSAVINKGNAAICHWSLY